MEQIGLFLVSHAGKLPDSVSLAGQPELVQVGDAQGFPEVSSGLGAHAGKVHDLQQSFGVLAAQLGELADLAGGQVLEHLALDGLAYAGKLAQSPA